MKKKNLVFYKKFLVAIKTANEEIVVKEFNSLKAAREYVELCKKLGAEVLIGWGE